MRREEVFKDNCNEPVSLDADGQETFSHRGGRTSDDDARLGDVCCEQMKLGHLVLKNSQDSYI